MIQKLYLLSDQLNSIADLGLYYSKDKYDTERYEKIKRISLELFSLIENTGKMEVEKQFFGYPHLTRKRIRRIMNRFGLRTIYPKLNLSKARKEHYKYPYLL